MPYDISKVTFDEKPKSGGYDISKVSFDEPITTETPSATEVDPDVERANILVSEVAKKTTEKLNFNTLKTATQNIINQNDPEFRYYNNPELRSPKADTSHTLSGKEKTTGDMFDYQLKSLSNSVIGAGVQFLSMVKHPSYSLGLSASNLAADIINKSDINNEEQPTFGTDRTPTGMEDFLKKREENAIWLKDYNPNSAEDVGAFALGVFADLPVFGMYGKAGLGVGKVLTGSTKKVVQEFVKAGVAKPAAEKILKNSLIKIAAETAERSSASAAALGLHAATADIVQQLGSGKTIDQVDKLEVVKAGGNGSLLGASVGVLGVGTSLLSRAATSRISQPMTRILANAGIKTLGFEAEVGTFLLGGKVLSGDETPTTFGDWVKMNVEFGILKLGGVPGLVKDPARNTPEFRADIYEILTKNDAATKQPFITNDELLMTKYNSAHELADAVSNGKARDLIVDPNIPASLKLKIQYSLDPNNTAEVFDQTESAIRVDVQHKDRTSMIRTFDKAGNLLEVKTSDNPTEINNLSKNIQDKIRTKDLNNFIDTPEKIYNIDNALIGAGYAEGLKTVNETGAAKKDLTDRTPEENAYLNKALGVIETYKTKFEKKKQQEAKKAEQEAKKQAEADKKAELEAIETKRQEDLAKAAPKKEVTPEQKKKDEINKKADAEVEKVESENIPEAKTEKVSETESVLPENKPTTIEPVIESFQKSEPIKNKVAEIEQRRQEELKDDYEQDKAFALKNFPPDYTETASGKNFMKIFDKRYISENADRLNKINAKYDAELSALKSSDLLSVETVTKPVETVPASTKAETIKAKADALADAILSKRFYTSIDDLTELKGDIAPVELVKAAWDGSLSIAAETVRLGGKTAQAISDSIAKALEHLRNTDWYKGLTDESKKIAEKKLSDEIKSKTEKVRAVQKEARVRIKAEKLATRKTRMKMPSEASGDKVTLLESTARNIQLAFESRAANEGAKSVKDSFKELGKKIKAEFKDALDKGFITGGQYRSVINRLSTATTDKAQKGLLEYVNKVLDDATYRKETGIAKGFLKQVVKSNRKAASKFSKDKGLAEVIERIQPKEMTVEELADFNTLMARVFKGNTVDIPALREISVSYARYAKDVVNIAKAKSVFDIEKSIEKLEKLSGSTTTMAGYIQMARAIENGKARISELLRDQEITKKEADAYLDKLEGRGYKVDSEGEITGVLGNEVGGVFESFQDQLKDIKDNITQKILSERKTGIDTKKLDAFGEEVKQDIYNLLRVKKEDIEVLDAKDIDSYLQFIRNIKEGAFVPESAGLTEKIIEGKFRRTYMDKSFEIYNNSKRGSAFRNKFKTYNEFLEYVKSKNLREIEVEMGNMGMDDGLVRAFTDVGNAINSNNKYVKVKEDEFNAAQGTLLKGLKERSVSKLGSAKQRIATGKWYSKEKEELNFMGMLMVESSFRGPVKGTDADVSLLDYMFGENFDKNYEANGRSFEFKEKQLVYKRMFNEAKAAGATKEVNGKEVLDIDKFTDHVRKDKRRAKYLDDIKKIYGSMTGIAEAATMRNGRTFENQGDSYMPLMQYGKTSFLRVEDLNQALSLGETSPKMIANATKERQNKLFVVETNPNVINKAYLGEMSRNYFVLPTLRATGRAIKNSSIDRMTKNEMDGKGLNKISELGKVYQEALVSRAAFVLNGRRREMYGAIARGYDTLLAAKKKALIANPNRVPAELMSNEARAIISEGLILAASAYNASPKTFDNIIDIYFGDKHFSRWEHEADANLFTHGIALKLEKGATSLVTLSDTFVGKRLFTNLFVREFKSRTGEEFDPKKYESDLDYRDKVQEEVDHAASWGLRRTEELFNSKNVMSQPELTRFFGHAYDPSNVIVKTIDGLQGFNRNEWSQMNIAYNRVMYGETPDIRAMGRRDLISIPFSNFLYMQTRLATNTAVKFGVQSIISGQVDDKTKKDIEDLGKLSAWGINGGASVVSLVMGGNQGLYKTGANLITLGMQAANIDSKTTNTILGWAENELYMQRVPKGGSPKQIIGAILPGISGSMFSDGWSFMQSTEAMKNALAKALDGGYVTKEQYLQIANGFNLVMTYGMANPASGWIQSQITPMLQQSKKASTEGGGYPGSGRPTRDSSISSGSNNRPTRDSGSNKK